jgi:hypothetical protein
LRESAVALRVDKIDPCRPHATSEVNSNH